MKKFLSSDQRGVGHLGLILAVVVVLAIGGVGYFVYNKNKDGGLTADQKALQDAIKNAKCDYDDKDLCKFFTSYKVQKYYTINTTSESDGEKSTMLLKTEGDGKSYMKLDGSTAYEVITIGDSTYTKATDGTWWKQTVKNETAADLQNEAKIDFAEPETAEEAAKTTYKKIGKEACGKLTCFKYQEIDPSDTTTTTFLWFDDEDYQLRRTTSEGNGNKSDSIYSYDKVSITEPSPVKELGPNQYLMPGASEPTTLPSAGDGPTPEEIEQLMQQYQ